MGIRLKALAMAVLVAWPALGGSWSAGGLIASQTAPAAPIYRPPPRPRPRYCPDPGLARRILRRHNDIRARYGLKPLRLDPTLCRAARLQALDMAWADAISHKGLGQTSLGWRVTQSGFKWWIVAENVAAGQPTPAEVMRAWMASPGHRRNILDPRLTHLGVGCVDRFDSFYFRFWACILARARAAGRPR
jgi:uncharacterized protein YkwD